MLNNKILALIVGVLLTSQAFATVIPYSIIVDAGSSGSRLHIFQNNVDTALPGIKDIFSESISVPLASFSSHPQDAGASLKPILDDAVKYLAANNITANKIEIRVFGTAGMRLLDRTMQRRIYRNVNNYISANYAPQLLVSETRTITGKEEGLFGWLDVNYLSNNFSNQAKTVGSLDVGGASTQIAFATYDISKPENETHLTINGQRYIIFSKSFLGLGQDQARYSMNAEPLAGACYPLGYTLDNNVAGNYSFSTCTSDYSQLIDNHQVSEEILPINPDQKFIAFSGAYYVFSFFGVDQTPNQTIVEAQIKSVCAETWDQMKMNYPTTDETYLYSECANGTYIDDLFFNYYHLHDGQLSVVKKINSQSIDWTLGAMFYQLIKNK